MAIQFFFWLGHDLGCRLGPNLAGLNGTCGPGGGGSEPRKKIRLVNRLGSGFGLRPTDRV